jgi:hypothetical protein
MFRRQTPLKIALFFEKKKGMNGSSEVKMYFLLIRSVAQSGSAPRWGCGGRGFESRRSDQDIQCTRYHRC